MLAHAAVSSITILQKTSPKLHQVLYDPLLSAYGHKPDLVTVVGI